uniref:Dendritic cell-specific transmembrane protein-like domain-containing protein n=1 Tax=Xenopus tropicalis TaxID=8364 RepID=L7N3B4_XENTR
GPVPNLMQNVEALVMSFECTGEMTLNHTKMMYTSMMEPVKKIFDQSSNLTNDTKEITDDFKEIEEEVKSTEGYDNVREQELIREETERNKTLKINTQKKFSLKTFLRSQCTLYMQYLNEWKDSITLTDNPFSFLTGLFEMGIGKCHEWFDKKYDDCMQTIMLPVLNHALCWPMKLKFVCGALNWFLPMCKKHLRIDPKFGDVYDNISEAIGTFKQNVTINVQITYNSDLRHDNMYITTYFREIDARRRKKGKRHLLPLKKGERADLIFPLKFALQGPEMKALVSAYRILSRRLQDVPWFHKYNNELFLFSPRLQNISFILSALLILLFLSDSPVCLPQPIRLTAEQYIGTCLLLAVTLILPVFKVYTSRLRRVLAAYFFPKTEKRRILHLYNELLRYRELYLNIKRKNLMITANRHRNFVSTDLRFCLLQFIIKRRCLVCNAKETKTSYNCKTSNCDTIYCLDCWKEIKKCCFVCLPDDLIANYACDED